MHRQEELEALLHKESLDKQQTIPKIIIEIQKNFDKLCLNLSRADGTMSFKELQQLNVYEFNLVRQNVMENHRRKKSSGQQPGEANE